MKNNFKELMIFVFCFLSLLCSSLIAENNDASIDRVKLFADSIKSFYSKINYIKTENNYKIISFSDESSKMIAASITFKNSGFASDTKERMGSKSIAAELLNMGPSNMSAEEYSKKLSSIAAKIDYNVYIDSISVSIYSRSETFEEAFKLFIDTVISPKNDDKSFEKAFNLVKNQITSKILLSPDKIASTELRKKIFANTKYANDRLGTKETIANISKKNVLEDILAFAATDNMEIIIGGNVKNNEIGGIISKYADDLPRKQKIASSIKDKIFKFKEKAIKPKLFSGVEIVDLDLKSSSMCFAQNGIELNSNPKNISSFFLLSYIFGGGYGFKNMLTNALRIKNQLVYYSFASPIILENTSYINGCMSYGKEKQDKIFDVTKSVLSELNNFSSISNEKFEEFKINFLRDRAFDLSGSLRSKIALIEFFKYPNVDFDKRIDFANNIIDNFCDLKPADVKNLSSKIIDSNNLGFVVAR